MKKNLFLLATTTLACLLLMEVVLRFISPPPTLMDVGILSAPNAKIYGWAYPPSEPFAFANPDSGEVNFFTTNSKGWKDMEHRFEKPEGVVRILFLGDSVTWGIVMPEDLYTRLVERMLKEKGFSNIEVISIGVGGWGTDQSLEALKVEGIKYKPDIVVYQFTVNDLGDNLHPNETTSPQHFYSKKPFRYELVDGALKKIEFDVHEESAYETLRRKIKKMVLKSALTYNISSTYMTMEMKFEQRKTVHWWDQYGVEPVYIKGVEQPGWLPKSWRLLEVLVVEMEKVAEANGAKFIIFSEEGENGKRLWNLKWKKYQTDGTSDFVYRDGKKYTIDFQSALKDLTAMCERQGITLIKPKRVYYRYDYDPHPNKMGNKNMARDIVDYLTDWEPFYKLFDRSDS
jgi:lysophospholipase L1-like esterase